MVWYKTDKLKALIKTLGQTRGYDMTQQQLEDFHKLAKQIREAENQVKNFKEKIGVKSPVLSGLPHGSGISDQTAVLAMELQDMEERLQEQRNQYEQQLPAVNEMITRISDNVTRLIFRFWLLYGYSWQEIADALGGYNTKGSVRERYTQQLRKMNMYTPKQQPWRIEKEKALAATHDRT